MICNICNGEKKREWTIEEGGVESKMMLPCMECNETGKIDPDQLITQQQEEDAWCECDHSEGVIFHDDGNSQVYNGVITCDKHHYSCTSCSLIFQIG
jgi:hypothetical protein